MITSHNKSTYEIIIIIRNHSDKLTEKSLARQSVSGTVDNVRIIPIRSLRIAAEILSQNGVHVFKTRILYSVVIVIVK